MMASSPNAKWLDIGPVTQIEPGMAATLPVEGGEEIAVFHTMRGEVYALVNACPHKAGPLSQGIVHGDSVSCPLHNWRISLKSGEALGEDKGCTPTIPARVDAGRIYLLREAVLAPRKPAASVAETPAEKAA
jgi:nitrite reductase (NADH) small subunit